MFVFPSIIFGFILSVPGLAYVYSKIFTGDLGFDGYTLLPSAGASVEAFGLGLLIPTIAAIVPIRVALSKELGESLNVARSKPTGMKITITDEKLSNLAPLICFGVLSTVYGASIYYILPLSLLSQNFSILLSMFFFILIGMIVGLSILAFNF